MVHSIEGGVMTYYKVEEAWQKYSETPIYRIYRRVDGKWSVMPGKYETREHADRDAKTMREA
jgi:hypothetical protein